MEKPEENTTIRNNSKDNTSSYRSIFKATSVFGGVQAWKIIIQLIQQKVVALLLGPGGMGISGLYLSATQFIQSISSFGLGQSAVKNVAEAAASNDNDRVSRVITALRKLVWVTGILGMILVIVFAPTLSKITFGNNDYTLPFIFLSVTLLFQQLSTGQSVVLQGLRKIKFLAEANVLGALAGLLFSVPLYYFFRINGIVPTLILNALTTLVLTTIFSNKVKIKGSQLSIKETVEEGKEMMKMGVALSLNSMFSVGIAYLIKVVIRRIGGMDDVGFYVAGSTIIHGYVGLVFNAMSTDYYPRLSSINNDDKACKEIINQQAEIASIILAPILSLFILLCPFIVVLLYDKSYDAINPYLQWAIIATMLKAPAWAVSFVFLAKSDMKAFLINEFSIRIIQLPFFFILYNQFGVEGLGIAELVAQVLYLIIVSVVAKKKYSISFNQSFLRLFVPLFCLVISVFVLVKIGLPSLYMYLFSAALCLLVIVISFFALEKRLDAISFVKSLFRRH